MFRNPAVYNRNDPVGIMGSSELLRQAVINNRPRLTEADVKRIEQETQFMPDESDPQGGAGGQILPPPVTIPSDRGTGGGPEQQNERSTIVPTPKIRPEGLGPKKKKDDDSNDPIITAQELSDDPYKVVEKLLGGRKSIDDLVKKNKRILDEYAPLAKKPDEKRRAFTDFFLRVAERGAAGEDLLAAAAKSARPAVEGFTARKDAAEAKQEQRDMVALTLGLEEKKTQDAALQEAALKLLEDKDPATLKLAKAVQAEAAAKGEQISLSEAIKRTYRQTTPGFQSKAFDSIMAEYPDANPLLVSAFLNGSIDVSDLALGIGEVSDIQTIIERLQRILQEGIGADADADSGTVLE
tara:strand:- start:16713 stop:17771 length:1059 start_codon:yes stop_codon:yes gene_type:complete